MRYQLHKSEHETSSIFYEGLKVS